MIDNNNPVPPGLTFFPQYLQQVGYETAFVGKWHMGSDSDAPQPGFDKWISFRGQGTYFPNPNGLNIDGKKVPQKGYITDELTDYALAWLDTLRTTAETELSSTTPVAFLGDYNIAPTDVDVWDIADFADSTHVTAAERERLTALEQVGLVEVIPRALKYDLPFTFWDYRQLAFPKNRGMRIDLVYGSPTFISAVTDAYVDRDARKPGKAGSTPPSDHAPVVIDADL